jgi:DNA mismatch endonuclease, patch repair protein
MPDVFTKEKRSAVMARIKGRNNKDTELVLVGLFREHGISGWRRHLRLPGRPDFTFRAARVVIFVDGCFWHGCPKHSNRPVQNAAFWEEKLSGNQKRDRRNTRLLKKNGWKVLRFWEHDIQRRPDKCIAKVQRLLSAG